MRKKTYSEIQQRPFHMPPPGESLTCRYITCRCTRSIKYACAWKRLSIIVSGIAMCHSLGVDHVNSYASTLRTRSFPACRATTSVKSLRMSVQSYDELCDLETGEGCSVSDVRSARKQGLYKEMPKSSPPKIPEPPPPRALPKIVSTDDNTAQSCFGTHYYWDEMYLGRGDFPADEYSWYRIFAMIVYTMIVCGC